MTRNEALKHLAELIVTTENTRHRVLGKSWPERRKRFWLDEIDRDIEALKLAINAIEQPLTLTVQ